MSKTKGFLLAVAAAAMAFTFSGCGEHSLFDDVFGGASSSSEVSSSSSDGGGSSSSDGGGSSPSVL